jgi:hypothetical protein
MDPNNTKKDIDQWLDAALGQYGKAEPRAGLETRILANLRAETDRAASKRRWWAAAGMVAATAAIAAVIWLGRGDRVRTPAGAGTTTARRDAGSGDRPSQDPTVRPVPQQLLEQGARNAIRRPPTRPRPPEVTHVAKAEQFPTPAPLSDQEKLLVRYVQEFPQRAALIARAQTELRKRTELEMAAPWPNADANAFEQQE